jgi:diacylglycerol kinase (ATP)
MTHPSGRRALLVVNPASRRGAALRATAQAAIESEGLRCDVLLTAAPGDAARAITDTGAAYDVVFTLGGDGTVMEVLSATPRDGPPVGILHGGTGNLIAQALGIPRRIRPAVSSLLAGRVGQIDLGRLADGRRFAVAAGVGVDATMTAEATPSLKRRLGVIAYIILGARALLRFERFRVRITVDGRAHEQEAVAVLVANFGTLLHDFITLGDGISYDDGQLNVCVFSPSTVRQSLRVARRLLRRDFGPDPCIWYDAGRRISVETDPPRLAQADGELLGLTPLVAEVEPLRGRVLLPRRVGRRTARGSRHANLQSDNPTRRTDG